MQVLTSNGKKVEIPDSELQKMMDKLDLTKEEAIELYLTDNDLETNEEQEELDKVAKKVKIEHGAASLEKKQKKPRTVKISDEKQEIFEYLTDVLPKNFDIVILKQNKLIEIINGDKKFKLDLIETRQKKVKFVQF